MTETQNNSKFGDYINTTDSSLQSNEAILINKIGNYVIILFILVIIALSIYFDTLSTGFIDEFVLTFLFILIARWLITVFIQSELEGKISVYTNGLLVPNNNDSSHFVNFKDIHSIRYVFSPVANYYGLSTLKTKGGYIYLKQKDELQKYQVVGLNEKITNELFEIIENVIGTKEFSVLLKNSINEHIFTDMQSNDTTIISKEDREFILNKQFNKLSFQIIIYKSLVCILTFSLFHFQMDVSMLVEVLAICIIVFLVLFVFPPSFIEEIRAANIYNTINELMILENYTGTLLNDEELLSTFSNKCVGSSSRKKYILAKMKR